MAKRKSASPDALVATLDQLFSTTEQSEVNLKEFVAAHPKCGPLIGAGIANGEFTRELIEQHTPAEFRAGGSHADQASIYSLMAVLGQVIGVFGLKPFPWESDDSPAAPGADDLPSHTTFPTTMAGMLEQFGTPAKALTELEKARKAAGTDAQFGEQIGVSFRTIQGWAYRLKGLIGKPGRKGSGRKKGGQTTPRRSTTNPTVTAREGSIAAKVLKQIPDAATAVALLKEHGSVGAVVTHLGIKGLTTTNLRAVLGRLDVSAGAITGRGHHTTK